MIRLFKKFNKLLVVTTILLLTLLSVQQSFAAWWEIGLPVPGSTKETKKETKEVFDSKFEFTHYTSNLEPQEIKDFYAEKLAAAGWKEIKMQEEIKDTAGAEAAEQMNEFFSYNLMFEKGDEEIVITFVPGTFEGQTRYTVSRGKVAEEKEEAKPKRPPIQPKKLIPVYPGVENASPEEIGEDSFNGAYFVSDSADDAASFYKNKMPDFGWELVNEERSSEGLGCPECAELGSGENPSFSTLTLDFANDEDDVCKIVLMETYTADKGRQTLITVTYVAATE